MRKIDTKELLPNLGTANVFLGTARLVNKWISDSPLVKISNSHYPPLTSLIERSHPDGDFDLVGIRHFRAIFLPPSLDHRRLSIENMSHGSSLWRSTPTYLPPILTDHFLARGDVWGNISALTRLDGAKNRFPAI